MLTHSRCSAVSGTDTPRTWLNRSDAASAVSPVVMRRHAAITADRLIPWRQWIPTVLPAANRCSSSLTRLNVLSRDAGTPRSTIGNAEKQGQVLNLPCETGGDVR